MQKNNHLAKVKSFLEQKDLRYEVLDDATMIVPYEIEKRLFKPVITINGAWIVVSCLIIAAKKLPSTDESYLLQLFKKLLVATHNLPEINYDVDEENNIYTSVDMRADIIEYNNFLSEFFAVPYGVKHFIEKIAPTMNPRIDITGCGDE
ncbi:MAG: hypothetical protein GYA24_02330 [Candidatus Lokiarchaeota archaeon]|nr:hypothetical protein [Candidatus Lokiarchaeota archaeon]